MHHISLPLALGTLLMPSIGQASEGYLKNSIVTLLGADGMPTNPYSENQLHLRHRIKVDTILCFWPEKEYALRSIVGFDTFSAGKESQPVTLKDLDLRVAVLKTLVNQMCLQSLQKGNGIIRVNPTHFVITFSVLENGNEVDSHIFGKEGFFDDFSITGQSCAYGAYNLLAYLASYKDTHPDLWDAYHAGL